MINGYVPASIAVAALIHRSVCRHGAGAGADEGCHIDGAAVRLGDAPALQEAGDEGGGEGVARADGVDDIDLRRIEIGYAFPGEDIAPYGATGQDHHLQGVFFPDRFTQCDQGLNSGKTCRLTGGRKSGGRGGDRVGTGGRKSGGRGGDRRRGGAGDRVGTGDRVGAGGRKG